VSTRKIDAALLALLGEPGAAEPAAHLAADTAMGLAAARPAARVFVEVRPTAALTHSRFIADPAHVGRAVRTASVPLDEVTRLVSDRDVRRVTLARRLRPLLDRALPRVHIPQFRTSNGLTGASVVVGIIDTGLDGSHPAFAGRVLRVWDQTRPGPGVTEGGYGEELSGAAIARARDSDGHGTHVAGIAAGDHPQFGGVAPRASLVIVRTTMEDTDIADGIEYIFRAASERQAPAVVNISIGGHDDPHDGTDPLSRYIDEVSGPGRIVCCAAGNEGDDNIHGEVRVTTTKDAGVRFRVPGSSVREASLTGWYAPSTRLEVSVRTPDGKVTPFQRVAAGAGSPVQRYRLSGTDITVTTPGRSSSNGDVNLRVTLRSAVKGQSVRQGVWQLRLRLSSGPATTVHLWALDDVGTEVQFSGDSRRDTMKVGSPGSASRAVSVASFTTRDAWTSLGGGDVALGHPVGRITSFSSEGPLRTGARKPDVTAPGGGIVSARSRHSKPDPEDIVAPGFTVLSGTSMASPFVAGLIALLLERDPTLTPEQVKARLRAASRIPGRRAGTFDRKWGYGLVDGGSL
jgi:subtilisin family serine protease